MMQELKQFGFDIVLFFAGLAGGIVFLTKSERLSRWEKFFSVLSGGLIANYLTPLVAGWVNLSESAVCGLAFLMGYGGLKSVEAIFLVMHGKITSKNKVK